MKFFRVHAATGTDDQLNLFGSTWAPRFFESDPICTSQPNLADLTPISKAVPILDWNSARGLQSFAWLFIYALAKSAKNHLKSYIHPNFQPKTLYTPYLVYRVYVYYTPLTLFPTLSERYREKPLISRNALTSGTERPQPFSVLEAISGSYRMILTDFRRFWRDLKDFVRFWGFCD